MKGLDAHFRALLAQHQRELDEPDPEDVPCIYCGWALDDETCTNPDCPEA